MFYQHKGKGSTRRYARFDQMASLPSRRHPRIPRIIPRIIHGQVLSQPASPPEISANIGSHDRVLKKNNSLSNIERPCPVVPESIQTAENLDLSTARTPSLRNGRMLLIFPWTRKICVRASFLGHRNWSYLKWVSPRLER